MSWYIGYENLTMQLSTPTKAIKPNWNVFVEQSELDSMGVKESHYPI